MARFVCSYCFHDVDHFFDLPPVRAVAPCAHCGRPVRRSVGSVAQAWMRFAFVMTMAAVWAAFLISDARGENGKPPTLPVKLLAGMSSAACAAPLDYCTRFHQTEVITRFGHTICFFCKVCRPEKEQNDGYERT